MKNQKKALWTALLVSSIALTSCEKPILDEANAETQETTQEANANVVIRISNVQQVGYNQLTRSLVDITGYSSRLNFVLYKDGEKVKSLSQMQGDEGYGQVAFSLMPGTYKVLVLAHSSKGNPTLSDPESIKFDNSISYSDTFYYYGDITVGYQATTHDLTLTRATSLLRFIIDDDIPASVAKVRFYYTGGSGVLDAVTGYGANVDSRQQKLYNITGLSTPITLPLYTFLQTDEAQLDVKVVAQDNDGNSVLEREFTGIPMKRNMITEYRGAFFEHDNAFTLKAETDWEGTILETY